jgi:hypothetical protein
MNRIVVATLLCLIARLPVYGLPAVNPLVTWSQSAEVTSNGSGAYFGWSVAVSGSTAAIGETNSAFGTVYVFGQSGGNWTQQAEITGGCRADLGAIAVAISGNTLVFGAPCDQTAYIWVQNGGVWTQQAKLTLGPPNGVFFGNAVAISGDTVVVGAPITQFHTEGYAYVYVRSGGKWSQQVKLTGHDTSFGQSVAISGNAIVVGAPGQTVGSHELQGAAYVFTRSGTTWSQQVELLASDGAANDTFGRSVSVSGSTAVVGAPTKTVSSNVLEGAAYVFGRSGGVWGQAAEVFASDAAQSEYFGYSVSVSGSTVVVGVNSPVDAAYVFRPTAGVWAQSAKLTPTGGLANDAFGYSVSVSGNTILVGAPDESTPANQFQGAGYFFQAAKSGPTTREPSAGRAW